MSNILELPQLAGTFIFANNADWREPALLFQNQSGAPVDLTGISFEFMVRSSAASPQVWLSLTSAGTSPTLVNGGPAGTLQWSVPYAMVRGIPAGQYVGDLIATGDGEIINLFSTSPAQVTVNQGVTR